MRKSRVVHAPTEYVQVCDCKDATPRTLIKLELIHEDKRKTKEKDTRKSAKDQRRRSLQRVSRIGEEPQRKKLICFRAAKRLRQAFFRFESTEEED